MFGKKWKIQAIENLLLSSDGFQRDIE